MKNIHKTALIGTGYWGSIIFSTLNKITKKKIFTFDKNKGNLKLLKKKFKEKVVIAKKIDELLDNKSIENIILATHPSVNFELGKKVLKKNKNLFIEKPIVTSNKELLTLIKYAKLRKKILMGGYIYLFNSYIKKIKQILNSKRLGKIKYIEIQRKNLGPIRTEVGAHIDLGSHDISILKYLFDKKLKIKNIIKKNILKNNISDITSIYLSIGNINCEIISSWLNPTKDRKMIFIGTKKMMVFDEMKKNNKLKIFNKYAEYPTLTKFKKNYISNKARIYTGKTTVINVKETDTLKNELMHFEYVSKYYKKPITNGNFCLDILKLII